MLLQTEATRLQLAAIYADYDETSYDAADSMLFNVKMVAHAYLDKSDILDDISDEEIFSLYEFVLLKLDYLAGVSDSLQVSDRNHLQFAELNISLQEYEDTGTLADDVLYNKLSNNISALREQLAFCYGILRNVVDERGMFTG